MADFSALKQSIETYIKNNGNKEITGAILQNILLSMVTTMGDGAINDNASDIVDIKGDIQNIIGSITDINLDITDINGSITYINGEITDLNRDLSDEINRAKGAETTTILFSDGKLVFKNAAGTVLYQLNVDSFLNAITTRLNTGALYAGYATPSTTPAALTSQEVFYLATQAGTYTNFHFNGGDDPIILTKDGIYFIVSGNDDDDWNAEPMLQLDEVPTASSNNAVKSGGVAEELALGAVYDVSAKNPTAGPNNDGKWESLSALLSDANLNTLIPTSVRKGGMSIKFVKSIDNKYVQYRLTAANWSTAESDWQGVDDEPTADSKNLVNSKGIFAADENAIQYSVEKISFYPLGSNTNIWWHNSGSKSLVFKVNNDDDIYLEPQSGGRCEISFLKSYNRPTADEDTMDVCSGVSDRIAVYTAGTLTIPSDANYLVVCEEIIDTDSEDYTPASMTINGVEMFHTNIIDIINNVNYENNEHFAQIEGQFEQLTQYATTNYYPLGSGTTIWWHTANSRTMVIPVSPNSTLHIVPDSPDHCEITFLKSYTEPTQDGDEIDVCNGSTIRQVVSTEQEITIPIDANYLAICETITGSDNYKPQKLMIDGVDIYQHIGDIVLSYHKDIKDKKGNLNVVCMGDSLTEFGLYEDGTAATGHGNPDTTTGYPEIMSKLIGENVINIGIGGSAWRARKQNVSAIETVDDAYSMFDCETFIDCLIDENYTLLDAAVTFLKNNTPPDNNEVQVAKAKAIDWDDVDYLVMFYGANEDWAHIGDISDYHNNTMCGAMNYSIGKILTRNPKIKIMIVAPFQMSATDYDYTDPTTGVSESEKCNKICEVAERNGCPSLNLRKEGLFNKWNHTYYFTCAVGGTYDGTHPWNGFNIYAERIGKMLLDEYLYK